MIGPFGASFGLPSREAKITPSLFAETIILKPLTFGLVKQRMVDWLNDAEVVKFSEQRHRKHSLEKERVYVGSFDGHHAHIWGIYAKYMTVDTHVGNITAHIDHANNIANVGILIGKKSAWRKGYGRRAWKAVCDWLLAADGGAVRKVEAGMMAENQGMRRVCEATGMKFEGMRPNHFLLDGRPVSEVNYGRFR